MNKNKNSKLRRSATQTTFFFQQTHHVLIVVEYICMFFSSLNAVAGCIHSRVKKDVQRMVVGMIKHEWWRQKITTITIIPLSYLPIVNHWTYTSVTALIGLDRTEGFRDLTIGSGNSKYRASQSHNLEISWSKEGQGYASPSMLRDGQLMNGMGTLPVWCWDQYLQIHFQSIISTKQHLANRVWLSTYI